MKTERNSLIVLMILGFFVICYSILRAYNLSFTIDESTTFTIVKYNTDWKHTANNHFINTYLMKISILFGETEFLLRLPNVLAHILYVLVSFLLVRKLKGYYLKIVSFVILNFSLPLLEFFSMARGYGISHAMLLLSIYFLYEFILHREKKSLRAPMLAILCACLAALGNFVLVNYLIALNVLILILYNLGSSNGWILSISVLRNSIIRLLPIFISSILFTFLLFLWLNNLKARGELYFGGNESIFRSVFLSILDLSLYGGTLPLSLKYLIIGEFFVIVFLLIYQFFQNFKEKRPTLHSTLFLVICLTLAFSVVQKVIFKTPYPTERTALFYLILFFVVLVSSANDLAFSNHRIKRVIGTGVTSVSAFLLLFAFYTKANLSRTLSYGDDMCTKEMMRDLNGMTNHVEPISIGLNWIFEPTVNFYRDIYKMDYWLYGATRDGVSKNMYSYYYCYVTDTTQISEKKDLKFIKYYPETNTVLLRRNETKKHLYTQEVNFSPIRPSVDDKVYTDKSIALQPMKANDFVYLEISPDSLITRQMNAFLILLDPSDWQNTLVLYDQLDGSSAISFKRAVIKEMSSPILIYRNWQDSLAIPSINVKIHVYR